MLPINLYIVKIALRLQAVRRREVFYSVKIEPYNASMTRKADPARKPARRSSRRGAPTRPARTRRGGRTSAASVETPYHHGALRDALLQAAERVLEREGLAGLTLRAVAREAGVSHAAPTHHFGDLTGLVSELAAIGFRQFNMAMGSACAPGAPQMQRMQARVRAYVGYAQAHPGMYGLMFRTEQLHRTTAIEVERDDRETDEARSKQAHRGRCNQHQGRERAIGRQDQENRHAKSIFTL